jgi:hypothetical protein
VLDELVSLRFVEDAHNAMVLGPVGVGKTFLATALGHIACRRRVRVYFERADRLFKRLKAARLDASYDAELRELVGTELLIIDDFALQGLDQVETSDFYALVVERHRRSSAVAPEGDGRPVVDGGRGLDGRRVRGCWQGEQRLGCGQLSDRWPAWPRTVGWWLLDAPWAAEPGVALSLPEAVQARLGGLWGHGRQRPPPPARGITDGGLDATLAVAPSGRAHGDGRPIMLGHGGEAGLDVAGGGVDHGRHAVHPPITGGAA